MRISKEAVSISRRAFLSAAFLIVTAVFLFSASGCSTRARAQRSLKRVVYEQINQFNKYHLREVRPKAYISGRRFYRTYKERIDHEVKMRSMKSPKTPFIATLSFTENTYLTTPRAKREDAIEDSHFVLSESKKREIVYAFVGGIWRRKQTY